MPDSCGRGAAWVGQRGQLDGPRGARLFGCNFRWRGRDYCRRDRRESHEMKMNTKIRVLFIMSWNLSVSTCYVHFWREYIMPWMMGVARDIWYGISAAHLHASYALQAVSKSAAYPSLKLPRRHQITTLVTWLPGQLASQPTSHWQWPPLGHKTRQIIGRCTHFPTLDFQFPFIVLSVNYGEWNFLANTIINTNCSAHSLFTPIVHYNC